MLTERQLQLVKYLQECDGYTTAGKLAEVFHVSSRSIRNDLDAVQYYLKELPVEDRTHTKTRCPSHCQKGIRYHKPLFQQ